MIIRKFGTTRMDSGDIALTYAFDDLGRHRMLWCYNASPPEHGVDYLARRLNDIWERGGWISVDEEMPGTTNSVLCYIQTNGVSWCKVLQYYQGYWCVPYHVEYELSSNVTHWMPLPEPPKTECLCSELEEDWKFCPRCGREL